MFCLVILVLFSCNRKVDNIENENESEIVNVTEIIKDLQIVYPIEEKDRFPLVCRTNILENNVDARIYPSFEAEIIYRFNENDIVVIQGFSYDGTWVCVFYRGNNEFIHGWIHSQYINIGDIAAAPLTFVQQEGNKTVLFYELSGEKINVEYTDWNNDRLIVWGPHESGYHYSNIPGVYMLNRDTQELIHMTHFGAVESDGAFAWIRFMNNFEYLLQDVGTSPGIRGLTVWRLSDKTIIFRGVYYERYIINNHTIQYVHVYDDGNITRGHIDEEIILYARAFMENDPPPEQKLGDLHVTLIIKCSLDLETGERNILGAEYILTQ
jgi:hypothetical protein